MADRREELRRRRLEAQAQRGSSGRRRLVLGYVVAGVLAAAVVVGLAIVIASGDGGDGDSADSPSHANIVFQSGEVLGLEPDGRNGKPPPEIEYGDLEQAADRAGCELRLDLPDEGNTHVPDSKSVEYKTNPPTSGNHNVNPLADGAYLDTPSPRNYVHSLEHGRVEIQYSSDLPEQDQLAIKGVFQDSPDAMLMFPNDEMPYAVAVTAWTELAGCKSYNERVLDVIRDFRDRYRGQGPEPVPVSL